MENLEDLNQLYEELTDMLRKIEAGDICIIDIKHNAILVILKDDGYIEPFVPNGEYQIVKLTDKGRDFLNRGGYSGCLCKQPS